MATPMEMEDLAATLDIETLISKLSLLEKPERDHNSESYSASENSAAITSLTSFFSDIETLIAGLFLPEKSEDNNSESNSEPEYSDALTSITSSYSDMDFNDRSSEIRDARLANSVLGLDEEIPEGIDETIKELLTIHKNVTSALGPMEFVVSEDYLEYKHRVATKKATQKKIPRSKGRRPAQKQTPPII